MPLWLGPHELIKEDGKMKRETEFVWVLMGTEQMFCHFIN